MKLTDESKAFHHAVYTAISQIPFGKATSYGHIAYVLGKPQNSRQVGASLKHYKEIIRQLNLEVENHADIIDFERIPWWRVVSSSGKISPRGNTGAEILQGNLLRNEGVPVENNSVI